MPHQCVRCGKIYDDAAPELLKGCSCGGKLFFYIKKEKLEQTEKLRRLSRKEKKQIERDVMDVIGLRTDPEKPVILDMEAILVKEPGKYDIDLVHLFKNEPLIIRIGEGKYIVDLPEAFKKARKKK